MLTRFTARLSCCLQIFPFSEGKGKLWRSHGLSASRCPCAHFPWLLQRHARSRSMSSHQKPSRFGRFLLFTGTVLFLLAAYQQGERAHLPAAAGSGTRPSSDLSHARTSATALSNTPLRLFSEVSLVKEWQLTLRR